MRAALVLVALSAAAFAPANEEAYLGLYVGGKKIGYTTYAGTSERLNGQTLKRSDSRMFMDTTVMGSSMQMTVDSTSWTTADGKPVKLFSKGTSAGRTQIIHVDFTRTTAKLVIENSGVIAKREVPLPKGAPIVDDALSAFLNHGIKPGAKQDFYVFDPETTSFIKNTAEMNGAAKTKIHGKLVAATLVTLHDPRADTRIYVDSKGGFLKAETVMGIEMLPESKAVALKMPKSKENVDLLEATGIQPDLPLIQPGKLHELEIVLDGKDLSTVPNDAYQTVKGNATKWSLDIHPPLWSDANDASIDALKATAPDWAKPTLHIDSDLAQWRAILQPVLADKSGLKQTVQAIHDFVFHRMQPNAGIGVLRDATEIYQTKQGVCRDYAVLTATLMRSAGIPTRLASGLVSWDGTFYYHAWVEVWDGRAWYPIDSTSPDIQVGASHIKLSEGNVEDAFSFPFLESVKMHVLSAK